VLSFETIMQTDEWLGLELRHLIALRAVADEGTFGAAARRLGYTQSAISQQIATLERIVGQKLIERPGGPKPVSLTDAGRLLLGHAEGITARLQAAQADLQALGAGDAGLLRIGTYQSVGARILPTLLATYRAAWPKVDITLTESSDDAELLGLVEHGALDVTFTMVPLVPGPFEFVQLLRDPYVLVVPADSPLARRDRPPTLREIAELPLIGNRVCRSLEAGLQTLRTTGKEPRIVFRSDHNETVQGIAAAGLGVALVPRLTVDAGDRRVVVLELGERLPPRLIALAWHRDRHQTRPARAFVEAAQTLCEGFGAAAVAA
jgi:DNA-binding transcriptional LysR family regulator